ncbi:MAG: general secretion pathway protein GspK [Candidatus Abyssobacteria bacterium SURF_17]|uniref:General secretion pathway protein GspK n=1 Tax=Candidatus Abyssobacteria bacterium SURF_17 TaxID=2093361 RepID=A0A419EMY8_9BACT|nr:MAG: general secretion pathway protein GspK [Candidatus Abyssubacteria bacterium SURF_17]
MKKCTIIRRIWRRRQQPDERGIALLLTLLVTVILAVVVLEFNYLMRVYATLSGNLVEDLRAEAAALTGVETAKALLLNDALADMKKTAAFDALTEEWASEIKVETSSTATEASISDEMGKLNLNRLVRRPTDEQGTETVNTTMVENVRRLFELLELDPSLVEAVIDWIDTNDQEEPFGAENAYYETLDPPILCKNGPLDSVEELLLIKGFDKTILYGDEEKPGLAKFVTVFGDSQGLVNINTADEKVLAALLNSDSLASSAVSAREAAPFESAQDISSRLSIPDILQKLTTRSSYFLVTSTGRILPESPSPHSVQIRSLLKRAYGEDGVPQGDQITIMTASWKVER